MYGLVRPLLFALSPATAHAAAMRALAPVEHVGLLRSLVSAGFRVSDPRLRVEKMGLVFRSPIGLAAGLDKNGERARSFAALGFGHVELGTVTARAQDANPAPNMFRLPADRALVNRLGFPNEGAARVAARIARAREKIDVPIGVSIGKSRSVPLESPAEVIADYVDSLRAVNAVADFVVVNVSSPNTKDLRALQAAESARVLFAALRAEAPSARLLVKIAPDLEDDAIDALCDEAKNAGFSGVVATNTTIARDKLHTPAEEIERIGAGGLSGPPLFPRALSVVSRVRARVGKELCVIGVGGVDGVDTTLAMLHAGADLVQLYTGFVYRGPGLPRAIAKGLVAVMDAEGASSSIASSSS